MELQLRRYRLLAGLTQEQLGTAVGESKRVVSAWERGETSIGLEAAARCALALGVTLDELAGIATKNGSDNRFSSFVCSLDEHDLTVLNYCRKLDASGKLRLIETCDDMEKSGKYSAKNEEKKSGSAGVRGEQGQPAESAGAA